MTLEAGTKLGPYEVTGAIGAAGIGEVYRRPEGLPRPCSRISSQLPVKSV